MVSFEIIISLIYIGLLGAVNIFDIDKFSLEFPKLFNVNLILSLSIVYHYLDFSTVFPKRQQKLSVKIILVASLADLNEFICILWILSLSLQY